MSVTTIAMTGAQTISINKQDGVQALSVQADATSSSFTFLGSFAFQGVPGETITLSNGQGINLVANSPAAPLSDITITWVSGTVNVVIAV